MTRAEIPTEAERFLSGWLGEGWSAEALRGDASVRSYYRVSGAAGERYMLCYYPQSLRGDVERFMKAYASIAQHSSVPAVLRHDACAVAQDDVGDRTLFDLLQEDRARGLELYREAIDLLVRFQGAPPEAGEVNPPFDASKFLAELQMTADYYVAKLSRKSVPGRVPEIFAEIASEMVQHPYVLCHRDYHGQNIHILSDKLFMIDYQDLRMGPDTYDVASLLRDRGVGEIIGRDEELHLLRYYAERINAAPGVRERYFVNLLQRSLKTLGTFARQAIERDRTHYLDFIPAALRAVQLALDELPRYRELRGIFPMNWKPE